MPEQTPFNRAKNTLIRLVGVQRTVSAEPERFEEEMEFYSGFFTRLREISPGGIRRIIRYEGVLPDGTSQTFIGLETESDTIPQGMLAWNLSETCRECIRDGVITRDEIRWQWKDKESGIGEFFVNNGTEFIITAYAYTDPGSMSEDQVELSGYDPAWPEQYSRFSEWLITTIGLDIILRTEHYGSTAIPGMPAKPVIDILVEIPSFQEARKRLLPLCDILKWEYWWFNGHMTCIVRERFMGIRTHHIHLAPGDHRIWRQLTFRDYMREHPDTAREYADLKRNLADRYPDDRERYTHEKEEFIGKIFREIDSPPSSTR